MWFLSSRVTNVFRPRSFCIPEFDRVYNKGGGPQIFKITNFFNALPRICQCLPESFGSRISSEIHKERALKISCHCDLVLTTASYYTLSSHPLPRTVELSEVPMLDRKTEAQRRSQTLFARQEAARRKRPPLLANYPHVRPESHWERIFRKREISHCRHFARLPALPAGVSISYLPPALAHPQLSLAWIGPQKGTLSSLPAPHSDRRQGLLQERQRSSRGFLQAPTTVPPSQITSHLARLGPRVPRSGRGPQACHPPRPRRKGRERRAKMGPALEPSTL